MTKKIWIGAHTSAAGGAHNALYAGQAIGATTVQFFTSNQKQWKGREITSKDLALWEKAKEETGIDQIMSHDSYLINLGSVNPEMLEKSRAAFRSELDRCHQFKLSYLNFHPGAHTTGTEEECLDKIAESLLLMEAQVLQGPTTLLLETTAGQGTSVGHKFEQIAYILKKVHPKVPVGVCIDTCHIFAAGYDIRTDEAWDQTLTQFDKIIGLQHLKAFHLNDSLKDLGSRVDRHACLGKGKIGMRAFEYLMTDKRVADLPKYLETPDGPPVWTQEIAQLKQFSKKN